MQLGNISENGGQILKEFLIDNQVALENLNRSLQNLAHQQTVLSVKTTRNLKELEKKSLGKN